MKDIFSERDIGHFSEEDINQRYYVFDLLVDKLLEKYLPGKY